MTKCELNEHKIVSTIISQLSTASDGLSLQSCQDEVWRYLELTANVVRRWWYCVPWVLVYGLNTVGLFASGIIAFYQLEDQLKLIGLLPIGYGQKHYI